MEREETGETPEVKPENDIINLVAKDQSGGEMHFKVRRNTKFEKIYLAYTTKKSLQPNAVRFTFDGHRINANDTPASHEMEDGDTIDVYFEQTGGC